MADEVEMHLQNSAEGWRVVYFPHDYEEVGLLRMRKEELVGIVMQLNKNGKALEETYRSQEETINKLRYERDEAREQRQEWIERAGLLHESFEAVLRVMAGDTDE